MMGWYQREAYPLYWFVDVEGDPYKCNPIYSEITGLQNYGSPNDNESLPFHRDWNFLMMAKERLVFQHKEIKIADEVKEHLGKVKFDVNVATHSFSGWDWTNHTNVDNGMTPIMLMFKIVGELSEQFNKEKEENEG